MVITGRNFKFWFTMGTPLNIPRDGYILEQSYGMIRIRPLSNGHLFFAEQAWDERVWVPVSHFACLEPIDNVEEYPESLKPKIVAPEEAEQLKSEIEMRFPNKWQRFKAKLRELFLAR